MRRESLALARAGVVWAWEFDRFLTMNARVLRDIRARKLVSHCGVPGEQFHPNFFEGGTI